MGTITVDKYDSKTGKGTLAYYARQTGTSVENLAKINNIANPDVIQEGATLTTPDQGSQQTTTKYRASTNERKAELDRIQAEAMAVQERLNAKIAAEKEAESETVVVDNKNKKKDPYEGLTPEERALREETDETISDIEANYDRIQRYADQSHRELIQATKGIYRTRQKNMKDSNTRLEATKNVANMRQGRSRYTPELAAGIITDEEQAGEARIVEIEQQMLMAIATANQAKADKDMERFNSAFDRVEKTKKEMNEQIEANYERAAAQDKALREKAKEEREAAAAELKQKSERAKTAAPYLADQLGSFGTVEEQSQFLQAYSDTTGIDMDILMGEVTTAANDAKYKDLQIANIENQIYNRNQTNARGWAAEERARNKDEKAEEEDTANETDNILNGLTKFNEVEDPKIIEQVKRELAQYGLFEEEPPTWFIQEYSDQAVGGGEDTQLSPEEVKSAWQEYRAARGII